MPTLGTCPVCERAIRVRAGKMVHHGYQRPGSGRIVGDCYGVGTPPYEVSSEGTRGYRDHVVAPRLARDETFLARLEAKTVEELQYERTVPVPTTLQRGWTGSVGPTRGWTYHGARFVAFDSDEGGAGPTARLGASLRCARLETTRRARWRGSQRELERCERLIRDWVPGELRGRSSPIRSPVGSAAAGRRLFRRDAVSAGRDEVLRDRARARAQSGRSSPLFVKTRWREDTPSPRSAIHCPRGYPEARTRAAVFAVAALASIATPPGRALGRPQRSGRPPRVPRPAGERPRTGD